MKKSKSALNYQHLKKLISEGDIEMVLNNLIALIEGIDTNKTTEIYLTSARFRKLEQEKLRGEIAISDYKTEFNSITFSILEILDSLNELAPGNFKGGASKNKIKAEIEALSAEFKQTSQMSSKISELRMKIHIARKMAEKFILWPDLIKEFKGSSDEAIICAIARKVRIVADIEDLSILESIAPNAISNISKGYITNAIAELIYAGQLRIGDDIRVAEMLEELGKEGDVVLLKNVERVSVLLQFLTGKIT